ncbi:MAG: hypothetical protein EKK42_02740 [Pseudonocardiaceae bacterium]|nr:MAG: hypothetical protein EKK42_02740 [Pseudonocardiaceae bacterium]
MKDRTDTTSDENVEPSEETLAAADPDDQTASVEDMPEVPGGPQVNVPAATGALSPDEAKDPHVEGRGRD